MESYCFTKCKYIRITDLGMNNYLNDTVLFGETLYSIRGTNLVQKGVTSH